MKCHMGKNNYQFAKTKSLPLLSNNDLNKIFYAKNSLMDIPLTEFQVSTLPGFINCARFPREIFD